MYLKTTLCKRTISAKIKHLTIGNDHLLVVIFNQRNENPRCPKYDYVIHVFHALIVYNLLYTSYTYGRNNQAGI
jgi:hypothetical protein